MRYFTPAGSKGPAVCLRVQIMPALIVPFQGHPPQETDEDRSRLSRNGHQGILDVAARVGSFVFGREPKHCSVARVVPENQVPSALYSFCSRQLLDHHHHN